MPSPTLDWINDQRRKRGKPTLAELPASLVDALDAESVSRWDYSFRNEDGQLDYEELPEFVIAQYAA